MRLRIRFKFLGIIEEHQTQAKFENGQNRLNRSKDMATWKDLSHWKFAVLTLYLVKEWKLGLDVNDKIGGLDKTNNFAHYVNSPPGEYTWKRLELARSESGSNPASTTAFESPPTKWVERAQTRSLLAHRMNRMGFIAFCMNRMGSEFPYEWYFGSANDFSVFIMVLGTDFDQNIFEN